MWQALTTVLCNVASVKKTVFVARRVHLHCSYFNVSKGSTLPLQISRTGFINFQEETRSYALEVPEKYNFVSDVIDVWEKKETEGQSKRSHPAFWFMYDNGNQVKWSFKELAEKTRTTAYMMENHCGLQKGENVMVILPKIPEFWLVNLAAIRAGIILCPGSTQLTARDMKYRFEAFKPKCVIASESAADSVDEASKCAPYLKTKVIVSSKPKQGWLDFHQLYKKSHSNHQAVDTFADDSMMVFFTSGTTGFPKMVEHTHFSYGYCLGFTGRYWMDLTEDNVMWNLSDPGWAKTAYSNIFGPWLCGSCIFVHEMPRFRPSLVLKILSEIPVDTLCAAPTIFRMLVQEDFSNICFRSLSHCLSGGEPLNPEVVKLWMEKTNLKIYAGYGQTETVILLGMYKCLKYILGSIGKPPPGTEIVILDENYNELGPHKNGEIAVKRKSANAAAFFKGYKDAPEKTAERFVGGYFLTGDIGYYDEDGYFWFVSRKDDIINSAGYRIGPFEVENALHEHPAVAEAGVTSSPDDIRGEVVTAYVVLKEEFSNANMEELAKELQEHVKKITAPYKYPRKVKFVDSLPKTISGKIKRTELKIKEWKLKEDRNNFGQR